MLCKVFFSSGTNIEAHVVVDLGGKAGTSLRGLGTCYVGLSSSLSGAGLDRRSWAIYWML